MGLIGKLVRIDDEIINESGFSTPGEVDLGVIPEDHFFEELKVHIVSVAPAGTTFKVIDQNTNIIIPIRKIFPDRQGTYTIKNIGLSPNVNMFIIIMHKVTSI